MIPSLQTLAPDNSSLLVERLLCIYYLVRFKKDKTKVQALIDTSSKINAITPAYMAKLGLKVQSSDVKA